MMETEETTGETLPELSVTDGERMTLDGRDVVKFTLSLEPVAEAQVLFDFAASFVPEDGGETQVLREEQEEIPAGEGSASLLVFLDDLTIAPDDKVTLELVSADGATVVDGSETETLLDDSDTETSEDDDGVGEDDDEDDDDSGETEDSDDDSDDDDDDNDDDDDDEVDDAVTLPPNARFDLEPDTVIARESDDGDIAMAEVDVERAFPGKPPVTLNYRVVTVEGGADADDFGGVLPSGELFFGPGDDSAARIEIPIVADGVEESTESFRVEVFDPAIGGSSFEGVAGAADGLIVGSNGLPDDGEDDDGETGDRPDGDDSDGDSSDDDSSGGGSETDTASRAVLFDAATLVLADESEVLGRAGGDEGVFLGEGASDVVVDANVERIAIPEALADLTFQVTSDGLAVSKGGETLLSLRSLNQPATLTLADGTATLTQTGAQSFDLAGAEGATATVGTDAVSPSLTLSDGSASAPTADGTLSARVFLDTNGSYRVADAVEALGRNGGDEALLLTESAQGVQVDANMERLDFAQSLGDLTFGVGDSGLEVARDGTVLLTAGSLNGDVEVRFADGSATLRQTGAQTFELAGEGDTSARIDTTTGPVDIDLSAGVSATAPGATGGTQALSADNDGQTLDASAGDVTFDFANGTYTVTLEDFGTGDVLDVRDVGASDDAVVNVQGDSDQTDGVQEITFTDPATTEEVTVRLVGLDAAQDQSVFNAIGFTDTFGSDSLLT